MKAILKTAQGSSFSAIDLGDFCDLMEYSYLHPKLNSEIKGTVFIGEAVRSSGTEISFQILPPDTSIPFLHQHKKHEEIYVFLKAHGQFQVDEKIFDVKEGSIVRIAPNGKRSYRNNSDTPLIFMCIQAQNNSIDTYSVFDGFRTQGGNSLENLILA